jgi:phage tail-like protein
MTLATSALGLRLDPPLNHNFVIAMADTSSFGSALLSGAASLLGDVLFGGFAECSGLEMTQSDERVKVGGRNGAELRFPTRTSWSNLVLKRGVSRISQSGWDWLYGFGDGKVKRMDGVIMLLDAEHLPHNIWTFRRAFPVKFTGPALNATGHEVAVETLELAHEGLWQLSLLKEAASLVGVSI